MLKAIVIEDAATEFLKSISWTCTELLRRTYNIVYNSFEKFTNNEFVKRTGETPCLTKKLLNLIFARYLRKKKDNIKRL